MLTIFSLFCQSTCGATFGVVPFISKRSNGLVTGIVAAGAQVGSVVTQVRDRLWPVKQCRQPQEYQISARQVIILAVISVHRCRTSVSYLTSIVCYMRWHASCSASDCVVDMLQAIFFGYFGFTTYEGFYWMGIMIMGLSSVLFLCYFPQWGGMLCQQKKGITGGAGRQAGTLDVWGSGFLC